MASVLQGYRLRLKGLRVFQMRRACLAAALAPPPPPSEKLVPTGDAGVENIICARRVLNHHPGRGESKGAGLWLLLLLLLLFIHPRS